jgi:hypothetical protein
LATYHAIAAVGGSILRLLEDGCPRGEFPAAQFRMIQAFEYQSAPMREGVSLFLYRVGLNANLRNRPARVAADGRRFRPSLPLDLYYLLTPWGETPGKQHRLLGWAMRLLEDTAILPAGLLNSAGPEHDTFRPSEAVELICEPLSVQDITGVWQGLRADWQLSVTYVARLVLLDSGAEFPAGPPVQTQQYALGPVPTT